MLNDTQKRKVWDNMLAAETRSYYFGDLASRYAKKKQWITGATLFFSSGAAATIVAKMPAVVPVILSVAVAVGSAYAIAVNLDGKMATMAQLHTEWSRIEKEYERLWNHTFAADAEDEFDRILQLEEKPSELATTDAPNDPKLLDFWQQRVFAIRGLANDHA
jgi:hypothetical protein